MSFDWFPEAVARARLGAENRSVTFDVAFESGASEKILSACEAALGQPLNEAHRSFLAMADGATFSHRERAASVGLEMQYRIFGAGELVGARDHLAGIYDAYARPTVSESLFADLIPIIDCGDADHIFLQPRANGTNAYLFCSCELGPEYWRAQRPVATTFDELVRRMLEHTALTGFPDFWIGRSS